MTRLADQAGERYRFRAGVGITEIGVGLAEQQRPDRAVREAQPEAEIVRDGERPDAEVAVVGEIELDKRADLAPGSWGARLKIQLCLGRRDDGYVVAAGPRRALMAERDHTGLAGRTGVGRSEERRVGK